MAEPVHAGAPLQPVDANQLPDWMRNTGSQFGVIGDAWKVTANTSMDRGIKFNPGKGWSDGILTEFDETNIPAPFSLPSNSTTQYYMIVSRVNWQEPFTRTFVAIPAGGSRALPTNSVDYKRQPGVIADFPVALVQVPGGSTQLGEIVDLRLWAGDGGWMGANSDLVKQYITRPMSVVEINGELLRLGSDGGWDVVAYTDEAFPMTFRSLVMNGDMRILSKEWTTIWNMKFHTSDRPEGITFSGGVATIQRAGMYEIRGQVTFPAATTGLRGVSVTVDPLGSGFLHRDFVKGDTTQSITGKTEHTQYFNAGSQVAVQAYQETGADMWLRGVGDITRWTIKRVGR